METKPLAPECPEPPPAYAEAAEGAATPNVVLLPQSAMPQQQGGPQQVIYVVQQPKVAPSFDSYTEYCPQCDAQVVTCVERSMGCYSWTMFCLGLFVFWPLLCCFCIDRFKDSKHACPQCRTVLSYKKR